jgi:hypothetical protein
MMSWAAPLPIDAEQVGRLCAKQARSRVLRSSPRLIDLTIGGLALSNSIYGC